MNLQKVILWNTRDNTLYEINVPDRQKFMNAVAKAVTKGVIERYYEPGLSQEKEEGIMAEKFAVIDTETNWNDEVMSIGVVVADVKTMEKMDSVYYIIDPAYKVGGMYADELRFDEKRVRVTNRRQALEEIKQWLAAYHVQKLFAYNASFDRNHLPEFSEFAWYDIMRLASYRQYNSSIPSTAKCFRTGRMKCGYGVENILKMLSNDKGYSETHNAVLDAEDELRIMQLLGHEISRYDVARIKSSAVCVCKV